MGKKKAKTIKSKEMAASTCDESCSCDNESCDNCDDVCIECKIKEIEELGWIDSPLDPGCELVQVVSGNKIYMGGLLVRSDTMALLVHPIGLLEIMSPDGGLGIRLVPASFSLGLREEMEVRIGSITHLRSNSTKDLRMADEYKRSFEAMMAEEVGIVAPSANDMQQIIKG